jgi:hypothetical protein
MLLHVKHAFESSRVRSIHRKLSPRPPRSQGNTVFCREGYASAEGVLAHLDEVKEELAIACQIVGAGGLDLAVMGPGPELDKLRSSLEPLGAKFFTLDEGAISKV